MSKKRTARCGIALTMLLFVSLACSFSTSLSSTPTPDAVGTLHIEQLKAQVTLEAAKANEHNAHATQMVADSNQGPVNIYLQGREDGYTEGYSDAQPPVVQEEPKKKMDVLQIITIGIVAFFVIIGLASILT